MSHEFDECYPVYSETRRRARKTHECSACDEPIAAGHRYWRVMLINLERNVETYKRCERCQALHMHLRVKGDGDTWPAEALDCGEEYEDHFGQVPERIAALAFLLPGEPIPEAGDDE